MPTTRRRITRPRQDAVHGIPPAAIKAALIGDEQYFRDVLGLFPWENSPLADIGPSDCRTEGDRRVLAYRRRMFEALEAVGGFRHDDLDADDPRAWAAVRKLYAKHGLDLDDYLGVEP